MGEIMRAGWVDDTYVIKRENGRRIWITPKHILRMPNDGDDPKIIWIWHRNMKAGMTLLFKPRIILMNLYSIKAMEPDYADMKLAMFYLDAVLLEELTHTISRAKRNHCGWWDILYKILIGDKKCLV